MHSDKERKDYTIGRIWNWVSNIKKPVDPHRDVLLSHGYLIENPKISLPGIGQSLKNVALLPNCDLVIGPDLIPGEEEKEKNQLGLDFKDFKNDVIYLKRAIIHGTINLNDFPKVKRGE